MTKKRIGFVAIVYTLATSTLLISKSSNAQSCHTHGEYCSTNEDCCQGDCSENACQRVWYNFPAHAKIKISRDASGKSWLYLEFQWDENCPPNFERWKAVEFEIGIRPKCFLQPKGGRDNEKNCNEVMGEGKYRLPDNHIPGIGENCYVDVWNYWTPPGDQIVPMIEASCGDLDGLGEACAQGVAQLGVFSEETGNFAVGLHDASALKAGVLYSIRYPVELNESEECQNFSTYAKSIGTHCTPFATGIHNEWGRAWVTMQTFNNHCDLPCDGGNTRYSCAELIGASTNFAECEDADKYTDFWLNRLCVPTGDWGFTPGYGRIFSSQECVYENNSSDLRTQQICCHDWDGDNYFAESGYQDWFDWVPVETYGTQTGDCNDNNDTMYPGAPEIWGNGIDNNCDGNASGLIAATDDFQHICECFPGEEDSVICSNGSDFMLRQCGQNCRWQIIEACPPDGPCTYGQTTSCGNCGISTCTTSNQWGPCLNQGICEPGQTTTQTCSGSGTQTSICTSSCQWGPWSACDCDCSSGICCDGCNYRPSSYVCDTSVSYQCQGGSPGQDVQYATIQTNCSGFSASCEGYTQQSSWQTYQNCSSSETCDNSYSPPQCVSSCQDAYTASATSACNTTAGTDYGYTVCLEVDQYSGATWKYRICKNSGTFPLGIKYELYDLNHLSQFLGGEQNEGGGVSCTAWHYFDVSHISSGDPAGLRGTLITPPTCTLTSCQYHTGMITISKHCL